MRVMADGTVRVTAPRGFDVSEFIAANKDWIASRHTEMDHVVGADIAAPDQMLVSGTWYTVQTGDRCHINHADQIITAFDPLSLRQHLTDEFRALINASITARQKRWRYRLAVAPSGCRKPGGAVVRRRGTSI